MRSKLNEHNQMTILILVMAFCSGSIYLALTNKRLHFNLSNSLPGFLYSVHLKNNIRPKKMDVVAFKPKSNRFFRTGATFLKYTLGVPGDRITIAGRKIFINGFEVGEGLVVARKHPLYMIEEGVIPNGYYYLGSFKGNGVDSRYDDIGLVHFTQIIGSGFRLF